MTTNNYEDDDFEEMDEQNATANPATSTKENDPIKQTHAALSSSFEQNHGNHRSAPTYQELRTDADNARQQIETLQQTLQEEIEKNKDTPVSTTMTQDRVATENAISELEQNKANPSAVYGEHATVSTSKGNADERLQTHDNYRVSETGNSLNISYDLTERNTGGVATAMNNPNHIIGASATTKSYNYEENKVGNNTVVTQTYTLENEHAPDSENVHIGIKANAGFTNTITGTYTYDKNKRLTSSKTQSSSARAHTDTRITAQKGQNISPNFTGMQTFSQITAIQGDPTRFEYTEYNQNGSEKSSLTASSYPICTTYTKTTDSKYTTVSYDNLGVPTGEFVYSGISGTIAKDGSHSSTIPMDPKKAEKLYKEYEKETNKRIKELTGTNSMQDYAAQLGTPRQNHNLIAGFNNNSNAADAAQAITSNEELNARFTDTPQVQINITGRETTTVLTPAQIAAKKQQHEH